MEKPSALGAPTKNPAPTRTRAAVPVKEKQQAIAFVNWEIPTGDESSIRSSKGFPLFDNEFMTVEEKALVELAKAHDGNVTVNAQLRIILRKEKPVNIDISGVKVVTK